MQQRSRRAMTWVAALVMFASACGTSGDDKASPTTKKTTTTSTTTAPGTTSTTEPDTGSTSTAPGDSTTTTQASGPDAERAKAANIVAADFPAGWTSSEHTAGAATTFAECAPDIDIEKETVAKASSPDFDRTVGSSQTEATSLARVLSSEEMAHSVISAIGSSKFTSCAESFIKKQAFKGGTASGTLSPVEVSYGDEASGIDGKIKGVEADNGKSIQIGVSIVAIRTGDVVTVLTGLALGDTKPTDGALFQKLAAAIASRQSA